MAVRLVCFFGPLCMSNTDWESDWTEINKSRWYKLVANVSAGRTHQPKQACNARTDWRTSRQHNAFGPSFGWAVSQNAIIISQKNKANRAKTHYWKLLLIVTLLLCLSPGERYFTSPGFFSSLFLVAHCLTPSAPLKLRTTLWRIRLLLLLYPR